MRRCRSASRDYLALARLRRLTLSPRRVVPLPTMRAPGQPDKRPAAPESPKPKGLEPCLSPCRSVGEGSVAAMQPAEALERIAYLLDRVREKPYRVRAYLRAAEIVKALAPDELVARVVAGTLQELDGIGPKTAAIITEVASSGSTAYLDELEEKTAIPVGKGNELIAQLKGDLHVHSLWSDGGAEIAVMARAARGLGHEYMALTDHSPRLTIANGLSRERLLQQLDIVAALNDLLELAVEIGCRFAINTDAHAPGQLEWQPYGADKAAETGVTIDRVVNSWSTDKLLGWTQRLASHTKA